MTEPPSPLRMLLSRHTKRREFITLLGGAAAPWPLAVRAQQPAMPVVGFMSSRSAADSSREVVAFRQGLAETGYEEGRNVAVEFRWAQGQFDPLPAIAGELVRRPGAILAAVGLSARVAKAATSTIPIVFGTGLDRRGRSGHESEPARRQRYGRHLSIG